MTATNQPKPPPTILFVHRKERRDKCSVEPLRGRSDFHFVPYPTSRKVETDGYVRLALHGPLLSQADSEGGLLVLDATWHLAAKMESAVQHVPPRSLPPGWRTAYPRTSKLFQDPTQGLATIEAIFVAFIILGRDTTALLDHYPWRDRFLEANAERLAKDGRL